MHEAGYTYTDSATISSLTSSEVRRLMEGQRVHEEIKQQMQKAQQDDSPSGALGKTVPRESDKQALRDFEARRQS